MWRTVSHITSGFTLVAFIFALAAWVYRRQILKEERIIKQAPEAKRPELIKRTLEFFDIDTRHLSEKMQYDLAVQQINSRSARFRAVAIVIVIIAFLAAGISIFALWRSSDQNIPSTAPNHEKLPADDPAKQKSLPSPKRSAASNEQHTVPFKGKILPTPAQDQTVMILIEDTSTKPDSVGRFHADTHKDLGERVHVVVCVDGKQAYDRDEVVGTREKDIVLQESSGHCAN